MTLETVTGVGLETVEPTEIDLRPALETGAVTTTVIPKGETTPETKAAGDAKIRLTPRIAVIVITSEVKPVRLVLTR